MENKGINTFSISGQSAIAIVSKLHDGNSEKSHLLTVCYAISFVK